MIIYCVKYNKPPGFIMYNTKEIRAIKELRSIFKDYLYMLKNTISENNFKPSLFL